MVFGPLKNLGKVKRLTRRIDRRKVNASIREFLNESGDPAHIGREFSHLRLQKATASQRGITGYTNQLTAYDGRLYLE